MIVDGKEWHYTAIKNISRLLSKLNGKTKCVYHYCMNCLNGFCSGSAGDKHYQYCSSNGHVKVNITTEKEKWLKFHDGHHQFKVLFMLYADSESILKPVDEWYRGKMNTIKAERKGKAPYMEKINTHAPSGWCVHITFAYGNILDPLKIYQGKDCGKVHRTHRRRSKTVVCNISTAAHDRTYQCVEKRTRGSRKVSNLSQNKKVRDHCHYTGLYREAAHNNCNLKYRITDHIAIVFHNLSGYDTHLFIKELGKSFNNNDIGVIAENKEKYIRINVKINV